MKEPIIGQALRHKTANDNAIYIYLGGNKVQQLPKPEVIIEDTEEYEIVKRFKPLVLALINLDDFEPLNAMVLAYAENEDY